MGSAVKSVLPIVGTVVGAYFGAPWLGGMLGGAAAGTAAGAAIGGLAGSALAGSNKAPKVETPNIPAQTIMPTPDSSAVAAAKRRSVASQSARQGRASTILTQGGLDSSSDKLGA